MSKFTVNLLSVIVFALTLTGCGTPRIDGSLYKSTAPDFELEQFFNRQVKAWGIVQDRKGNLIQQFEVDIDGSLDGEELVLDETFRYNFGEGVEKRIWRITKEPSGGWSGTADDILDYASGESFGNAFFWNYQMDLPVGSKNYRVTFDDWIWAFDDKTIINRSYIRKFGITFAEVTIFMRQQ